MDGGDNNGSNNGKNMMVNFDRQKVISALGSRSGDIQVTLSGQLMDDKKFEGTANIRVIE